MNKDCNIIKDLLPLYADDICSEESKALVEEHIKTCGDCKKEYEAVLACPLEFKSADYKELDTAKEAGKRLKKIRKKTVIKAVSISVVVILLVSLIAATEALIAVARNEAELLSCGDITEMKVTSGKNEGVEVYNLKVSPGGEYKYEKVEMPGNDRIIHTFTLKDGRSVSMFIAESSPYQISSVKDVFLKAGMKRLGEMTEPEPAFNPVFITRLLSSELPEYSFFSTLGTKLENYAYYEGWCKTIYALKYYYFENDSFSGYGYMCNYEIAEDGSRSIELSKERKSSGEYNGAEFKIFSRHSSWYAVSFNGAFTEQEISEFLSSIYFVED